MQQQDDAGAAEEDEQAHEDAAEHVRSPARPVHDEDKEDEPDREHDDGCVEVERCNEAHRNGIAVDDFAHDLRGGVQGGENDGGDQGDQHAETAVSLCHERLGSLHIDDLLRRRNGNSGRHGRYGCDVNGLRGWRFDKGRFDGSRLDRRRFDRGRFDKCHGGRIRRRGGGSVCSDYGRDFCGIGRRRRDIGWT